MVRNPFGVSFAFIAANPQGFLDIRNDRRAFLEKLFLPIWADAEWIFGYLAEGGGHFLLLIENGRKVSYKSWMNQFYYIPL